jgi:5-deoxy-glucuronate isomerase
MARIDYVAHSRSLPSGQSGELIAFSREEAGWEWMSFSVRRLAPAATANYGSVHEEIALVLLSGTCLADWGKGEQLVGQRESVFAGFPYALYLPAGSHATLKAATACEVAECRVPSTAQLEPRLITPQEVVSSIRGGENSSRQIVDIIRPEFPADRLIAIEVYTPAGNWSSYPPHKHDVHDPPTEVDLDEIYYYRINDPRGFALQTLYNPRSSSNLTLKVHDGDAVLVREGYHPVVAGPGYDVYYLNFLAGTSRTLAVTEDPDHLWIRSAWKQPDPRLPLVRG